VDRAAIDAALVTKLVAAQFPQWAHLPVSAVELNGWDNITFRLGDDMSVRLPSADPYVAQADKEHRWLPVLAPQLPLPIPEPLAQGVPGGGFPRPWSVYRWRAGEHAIVERIPDLNRFATDLAAFLAALYRIDPAGGPPAGEHSFFRGGPLTTYDAETRATISALAGEIDTGLATEVWETALAATWEGAPVWVHGDVAAANLLVVDGALSAVIDFGCSAVGDPACDVTIAWTFFFDENREAFRDGLPLDDDTWARGRGWALWKALITHLGALRTNPAHADRAGRSMGWRPSARHVIDDVLAEHRRVG